MPTLRRLLYLLLPLAFAALAVLFLTRLGENPRDLPSVMIGQPLPAFDLPAIAGDGGIDGDADTAADEAAAGGLSATVLRQAAAAGQPVLVNFFASWCVPCRAEHPLVTRIAADWPVYGINYKDSAGDATAWLAELGDPYRAIGADLEGRTGIEFGVYGMPETYVIDGNGIIRYRLAGPLSDAEWNRTLLPLLQSLVATP